MNNNQLNVQLTIKINTYSMAENGIRTHERIASLHAFKHAPSTTRPPLQDLYMTIKSLIIYKDILNIKDIN